MARRPFGSQWRAPVVIALLVVCLLALTGLLLQGIMKERATAERGAESYTPPPVVLPTPAYGDIVQKLRPLPRGSRAFFFGDSYTYGYGATDPPTRGLVPLVAKRFGWKYTSDGLGGSGYVTPGPSHLTYVQRLSKLHSFRADVIFLEGGLNDETQQPSAVVAGAERVVQQLRHLSPRAQIVMVGPADPYRVPEPSLAAVDRALRQFAADHQLPYADLYLVDVAKYTQNDKRHPDDRGYAMLARELESFIEACLAS